MGVLGRRLEAYQVDHVHNPSPQLRRVRSEEAHRSNGLEDGHLTSTGWQDIEVVVVGAMGQMP